MNYLIVHDKIGGTHELQVKSISDEATRMIQTVSANIVESSKDHQGILIDVRDAMSLSLPDLARELRHTVNQLGHASVSIAIVISFHIYNEALEDMLKTILERSNIELFTKPDTARLWLQLEQTRNS